MKPSATAATPGFRESWRLLTSDRPFGEPRSHTHGGVRCLLGGKEGETGDRARLPPRDCPLRPVRYLR
jgi:hypothetical protein